MRIMILTHGAPPLPGTVVVGNVLRAWSLGLALEAAGHRVHVVTRAEDAAGLNIAASELPVVTFGEPEELRAVVSAGATDALIACQWDMLGQIPDDLKVPVVADLYAPRMLEAQFQGIDLDAEFVARIETLSRADWFVCTTARQRWFYLPWLMMAGVDCRRAPLGVVPLFPLRPAETKAKVPDAPIIVAGGVFWPWQDPTPHLDTALAAMDRADRGKLVLFGGRYPLGAEGMRYSEPPERLKRHPRVEFRGMVPYDALVMQYRAATAALNVMAPNAERELSFSFRDIDYLSAGLPLIVGSYCEMASLVGSHDAGWVVDPADPDAVARAVTEAVTDHAAAARKSANAVALAHEEFDPLTSVKPLLDFLAAPTIREKRPTLVAGVIRTAHGFYKSAEARVKDQERLRELQEKIADLQVRLVDATEGRDQARRRASEVETRLTAAETKESWAREEMSRLKARTVELEAAVLQHAVVDDRLARVREEHEAAQRENGWLRDELKRAEAAAREKTDEAARHLAEVQRLRPCEPQAAALPSVRAELETVRQEARRLGVEHERRLVEIDRLKGVVDERERALRAAQDERDTANRDLAWARDEIKRRENALRDLAWAKDEIARADAAKKALEEAARAKDEEIRRRDAEIENLRPVASELNGIKSLPLYKVYKKILG